MLDALQLEARHLGKPQWRPLLDYVARLHTRSVHPPRPPLPFAWEEIGPGYCAGLAFGHWDIVHAALDTLPATPEHARAQILNTLAAQQADGLVPGVIYFPPGRAPWMSLDVGHPPVWPIAVDAYSDLTGDNSLRAQCWEPLGRQIGWFEAKRRAEGGGFFYADILTRQWESGVDEGIRFDDAPPGARAACMDASSHVFTLYETAARWAALLGHDPAPHAAKADALRRFIQDTLFDARAGFFHDSWDAGQEGQSPPLAFEGMWPLVVGAATPQQAARVINENLLEPSRFFTPHPIATVGVSDPRFELRMWRGPAWNSMTFWAARGCLRFGRPDAACLLLERALDDTAAQFTRTGTIWEFYHPMGGDPRTLARKPQSAANAPSPDYLGHNPLLAMARLWEQTEAGSQAASRYVSSASA